MREIKKILLIEDDVTSHHLTSRLLKKAGYEVEIAQDGQEGLNKFRQHNPDIVLCDIVLPRVDGFTLCRNLRKSNDKIPIIIISSNKRMEGSLSNLGAQAFMPKPVDEQKLLEKIIKLLGPQEIGEIAESDRVSSQESVEEEKESRKIVGKGRECEKQEVSRSSEDKSFQEVEAFLSSMGEGSETMGRGKKLLIVDDDRGNKLLLKRTLEPFGFSVLEASNGKEALDLFAKEGCDLILCDIVMPEMNGFTFLKEIKKNEEKVAPSIVILTARKKMEATFLDFGVDAFLTKPLDPKEILITVAVKTGCTLPSELSDSNKESIQKPDDNQDVLKKQEELSKEREETIPNEKQQEVSLAKEDISVNSPKVIIFGKENKILDEMKQKLQKQGCLVETEQDEQQILTRKNLLDYSVILMQIHFNEEFSLDKTVELTMKMIKKEVRETEAKIKDKTDMSKITIPKIVLYKLPEEVSALSSSGENLAAIEDLLQKCKDLGVDNYIGMYTPIAFDSKIKKYIRK